MAGRRRDSKHRVLRRGESIRADGKYQFKYHVNGTPHFVYSWRLEPTDKLPAGKKPCLSLRELEKQIGYDLDSLSDPTGKNMTVEELVERYLSTKTGVKPNTLANYNFVKNLMKKEPFNGKKISQVKTSDAKLFLIKLQQDGRRYSTIKTVRGVLRPAFQMAVDDDVLRKNPFGFELATVVVNDSVTREAITRKQMRQFLKFVHDDNVYCKYYEVVYILFHTGMRISEFCGLTLKDLDMKIAEYSKAVLDGRPNFHINLVIDVSPYCDCHAENDLPILPDVGMFASFDPVALDQACADACNAQQPIPGSLLDDRMHERDFCDHHDPFVNTTPESEWETCLAHAEKIGIGTREYELIEVK